MKRSSFRVRILPISLIFPLVPLYFLVIPPVLTVPVGGSVVNVSEGGNAELVCLVEGKPRPPVLWSRANKDMPMPSGDWMMETRDGRLRLTNVTRDMAGAYRCQTAPYNGLNIKRRLGQVQLNVECEYSQHYNTNIRHLLGLDTIQVLDSNNARVESLQQSGEPNRILVERLRLRNPPPHPPSSTRTGFSSFCNLTKTITYPDLHRPIT